MLISRREGKLGGEKKFVYAKRCLSRTRTHLQRERMNPHLFVSCEGKRRHDLHFFISMCVQLTARKRTKLQIITSEKKYFFRLSLFGRNFFLQHFSTFRMFSSLS